MAIHVIETSQLQISIADTGAELSSVIDRETGTERIWTADPSVWNRHAPILFPFVGKVNNGKYRVNGKEYNMKSQHGFARDMVFTCIEETADSVTHLLCSSEETLKIYPFEFKLTVQHTVKKEQPRQLLVKWMIENIGNQTMLYSIGGHPGFMLPDGVRKEDCSIVFPGCSELRYINASAAGYALAGQEHVLKLKNGSVPYQSDVPDTWIFENHQIQSVVIADNVGKPFVTMNCEQFPMLAVWANQKGSFICLEPWLGRTDNEGFTGTLNEKTGIEFLPAGETKKVSYSIQFHK